MAGPRALFEGQRADQVVAAIEQLKSEGMPIGDLLDRLAAESEQRFGRPMCVRTIRRTWDRRRAELYRGLHSGDPVRLAELQASQSEAAKLNLERAAELGKRAASVGGVPVKLPGGRPEPKNRKVTAEQLKAKALLAADEMLDEARLRVRDPATMPKDVAELVSRVGDLAVSLNTLVEEPDD